MVNVSDSKSYKVVGTDPIRHDGYDKVTGRAIYGADVKLPGLIWGSVLRSPHAHAVIKSIDTSAAEKMDGVFAVMTAKDFPSKDNKFGDIGEGTENLKWAQDNILASDKIQYKGQAVAAVAARDRNTADEAASKIKVVYEVLESVTNVEDATKKDAPILFKDLNGNHLGKKVKNTKGYGILQVKKRLPLGYLVGGVEEKPVKPKSNLGILALYYFRPEIFSSLKKTKRGKNNEIQLTDGIQQMINNGKKVIAIELAKDDTEIDVGTVESYRNAQISSYKIA